MLRFLPVTAAILLALGIASAVARAPDNADPMLHGWFESLKQPGSGASCCSIADCRPVDYRMAENGYEAFIDAAWVPIPEKRVLHGEPNPTARAILCRSPLSGAILCFVPANET